MQVQAETKTRNAAEIRCKLGLVLFLLLSVALIAAGLWVISNAIFQLLTVLKRSEHSQINQENTLYRTFVTLRSTFHARCGEPWTLERMAKHSGYSTSHFCALYKSFFGISPIDDLLDRRLELAKELIAQKTHQIQEIAALCGFSSLHYFSEFFKKRTGKSPSEY